MAKRRLNMLGQKDGKTLLIKLCFYLPQGSKCPIFWIPIFLYSYF